MNSFLMKKQTTGAVDTPDNFEDGYNAEGYYVAKVDDVIITFVSYIGFILNLNVAHIFNPLLQTWYRYLHP